MAADSLLKIANKISSMPPLQLKSSQERVILTCTDALTLSLFSHEVTEQTRRDFMAYRFSSEHKELCYNVPKSSKKLFGDDVNKRLDESSCKVKPADYKKSKNSSKFSKHPKNSDKGTDKKASSSKQSNKKTKKNKKSN